LAVQPDHVHLFVRVWPSVSAADVVKECKGLSAFTQGVSRTPSFALLMGPLVFRQHGGQRQ
jgi:REP element-mobilizing transposase RayT